MKKTIITIIAAIAMIVASCTGQPPTAHLSIMGAKIGMPKAEALDTISRYVSRESIVDKYAYHSLECVQYQGAYIPRVDLIWGDDTLRSIKYKFTSFDDEATAIQIYTYVKDSTSLGHLLGLDADYTSNLTGVTIYEDTDPFDNQRLNILVDPSGKYKDAPILRPTPEQLNLGSVTLGMSERDARNALRTAYGSPLMEVELFACYELVFDVDFTWKEATYYFADNKLWMCSYETYEHSEEEAYKTARTLALAGRKYRFIEAKDMKGNKYYKSRVMYYVDREAFISEEDGSYHPIATIEVKKGKKGYYVNASYQYSEN